MYYYLDNIDKYLYEDKIEVPRVVTTKRKNLTSYPSQDTPDHISSSSYDRSPSFNMLFYVGAKAYFD